VKYFIWSSKGTYKATWQIYCGFGEQSSKSFLLDPFSFHPGRFGFTIYFVDSMNNAANRWFGSQSVDYTVHKWYWLRLCEVTAVID
jgi:hypothetical protein